MRSFFEARAIARIRGTTRAPRLKGEVRFYQKRNGVWIVAQLRGLPPSDSGFFGFHIHEGESCSGEDLADTMSHYNPAKLAHPRHAGDLPPLMEAGGGAVLAFLTDRFPLHEILGRTVVIHDRPDDFVSQPAGNAGTKIACGVIERG